MIKKSCFLIYLFVVPLILFFLIIAQSKIHLKEKNSEHFFIQAGISK